MKINTRQPERLDSVELDEPHFDEEATLLSARPVVPLEVVEKKERSVKRWALAAAVVVALLIGAFSATLVYKLRSDSSTITQEQELARPTAPALESGVEGMVAEVPVSAPSEEILDEPAEKVASKPVSSRREPVSRIEKTAQTRWDDDREEQIADREMEKENRRAEKRERRRMQRRAERQAQRDAGARSDDLLRIREIFEGVPRP